MFTEEEAGILTAAILDRKDVRVTIIDGKPCIPLADLADVIGADETDLLDIIKSDPEAFEGHIFKGVVSGKKESDESRYRRFK
jgi:hypothetical protein